MPSAPATRRWRATRSIALASATRLHCDLDKREPNPDIKRRWLALSAKWALPCLYSPVWTRGNLPLLERAMAYASQLHDTGAEAKAGHWLAWLYYVLGDYRASIDHYQRPWS
jgi:hypothetical protein